MNVIPTSRWIRLSSTCICLRSLRSSAPSGSSSSSTDGRFTSARASATRWRWPPDSCAGLSLAPVRERDELERLPHPLADLLLRHLAPAQAERDVLADVEMLEQRVGLEHRVDVALVGRHARDVVAVEPHGALDDGCSKPAISRSVVVLPQPDGPSSEKNSPWRICSERSLTASKSPKCLQTLLELDRRAGHASLLPVRTATPLSRRPSSRGSMIAIAMIAAETTSISVPMALMLGEMPNRSAE